jgi:threonine dehydrogenase-like Zn-dependent dehydrogenase
MELMKAIVKQGADVRLRAVSRPAAGLTEVVVRVRAAGLCRTDLFVARGLLPSADPVILGHEFSGAVDGTRVAVMPVLPSGAMLGVDRDGAFAEFVAVPESAVHALPAAVPDLAGAYAEPVAASLAVLKTGIRPDERGLVYGSNRIARLTGRVLRARGFALVTAGPGPLPENGFDFIVETCPTPEAFDEMIRAVRPGGRIVLKSRPHARVPIDLAAAVRKEISFHAAAYAPFDEALDLLASGRLDLSDLLGPIRPLEDFERVFAEAGSGESVKTFFAP